MSKTVIIIDDSRFVVDQLEKFFKHELEYKVIATGANGEDAVLLYKKHKPDLITLDIIMPTKKGSTAAREILTEFPDATIMMISAVRGNEMLECMSFGAKGYVEKPLRLNDPEFVNDFKTTIEEIFMQ